MRSATRYPKGKKKPGKPDKGKQEEKPNLGVMSTRPLLARHIPYHETYYGKKERKFKGYDTKTTVNRGKSFSRVKR